MQIKSSKDLIVYQKAYALAMKIFEVSKSFPAEKILAYRSNPAFFSIGLYKSARGVGKAKVRSHFVSKLTDADGENGETDSWLDFACECGYLAKPDHAELSGECREVGAMLGSMISDPSSFILRATCGF